jgi:hypothetical protein
MAQLVVPAAALLYSFSTDAEKKIAQQMLPRYRSRQSRLRTCSKSQS